MHTCLLALLLDSYTYYLMLLFSNDILVLDEISMISGETLDLISYALCKKMKNERFVRTLSFTHSSTYSLP